EGGGELAGEPLGLAGRLRVLDRVGEVAHRLVHPGGKLRHRLRNPLVGVVSNAPNGNDRAHDRKERDPERADKNEGHHRLTPHCKSLFGSRDIPQMGVLATSRPRFAALTAFRYHAAVGGSRELPRLSVCIRPVRGDLVSVVLRRENHTFYAHRQSADSQRSVDQGREDEDPCARGSPAEARCLHARLDDDPEEAELGPPQGGPRSPDERPRGRYLHPRRGPQPAGALGRARARRPRQGSPGLPLQDHPVGARRRRRLGSQAGTLEVRREAERKLVPRRAEIQARPVGNDPIYDSQLVTQLMNRVMLDGKKSVAEKIVYDALAKVGEKTGRPPVEVLEQAVKTVTPVLEVRSRRVGGANYQVPVEVPQRRGRTLAIRWLVTFARDRREKHMTDK